MELNSTQHCTTYGASNNTIGLIAIVPLRQPASLQLPQTQSSFSLFGLLNLSHYFKYMGLLF